MNGVRGGPLRLGPRWAVPAAGVGVALALLALTNPTSPADLRAAVRPFGSR